MSLNNSLGLLVQFCLVQFRCNINRDYFSSDLFLFFWPDRGLIHCYNGAVIECRASLIKLLKPVSIIVARDDRCEVPSGLADLLSMMTANYMFQSK